MHRFKRYRKDTRDPERNFQLLSIINNSKAINDSGAFKRTYAGSLIKLGKALGKELDWMQFWRNQCVSLMILTSFIAIESGLLEAESFSCSGRERIVIKTTFYWAIAGNEFCFQHVKQFNDIPRNKWNKTIGIIRIHQLFVICLNWSIFKFCASYMIISSDSDIWMKNLMKTFSQYEGHRSDSTWLSFALTKCYELLHKTTFFSCFNVLYIFYFVIKIIISIT